MNTPPTINQAQPAPYAAVLHFKPTHLWQNKFPSFTFRSDQHSPPNTPMQQQYSYLSNYVLNGLRGQFQVASLFDNCGTLFIPKEVKTKNLVWQANNLGQLTIDHTKHLKLDFLNWSFNHKYLYQLAESFNQEHTPEGADKAYREMIADLELQEKNKRWKELFNR